MQLPKKAVKKPDSASQARKELQQEHTAKLRSKIMQSKGFANLPQDPEQIQEMLKKMDPATRDNYAEMEKNIDMLIKRIQQTIKMLTNQTTSKKRNVAKSKQREVSYVEIPKLLNFTAAQPELVPWSHERRNELFSSVFQF